MVVQNPLDRVPGDVVGEIRERATDARVPPRWILDRHPHHEVGHLAWRYRPASTSAGAGRRSGEVDVGQVAPGGPDSPPGDNRSRPSWWRFTRPAAVSMRKRRASGISLRLLGEQPLAPTLFRRFANLGRFVAPYGRLIICTLRDGPWSRDVARELGRAQARRAPPDSRLRPIEARGKLALTLATSVVVERRTEPHGRVLTLRPMARHHQRPTSAVRLVLLLG